MANESEHHGASRHIPRDDPAAPLVEDSIVCTSAYPLLAHAVYWHYRDTRVIQRHFASLDRFMRNLLSRAGSSELPDFEVDCGGSSNESSVLFQAETGPALAAFKFVKAADAMAAMAAALGPSGAAVAQFYASLAVASRARWHAKYWNATAQVKSWPLAAGPETA